MKSKILTIVGPTAVGKTRLAIEVAQRIDGEIIGLDSRQMYRGMEIGTAQPSADERSRIPHHLIGIKSPTDSVSAGEYAKLVKSVVEDIYRRGNRPILCGGAGLYYRALTQGIFTGSVSDLNIRARLNSEYDENGSEKLLQRLRDIDPEYAEIVHPNNKKRLVRALEIFEATGKPPSEHFRKQKEMPEPILNLFTVLVTMKMEKLESHIRQRTTEMLASGWITETKRLRLRSEKVKIHPLDSIGYLQIIAYLNGELSYDEMVEEINIKTRQYAKRQIKWFSKEPVDLVIDLTDRTDLIKQADIVVKHFLETSAPILAGNDHNLS